MVDQNREKVDKILKKNGINYQEIETNEDNPTESRINYNVETSDQNYYLSFMHEKRQGPLYIYDKLSHKIRAEAYSFQRFRDKLGIKCPEVIDTDFESYILFTEMKGERTVAQFGKETPDVNDRIARKLGEILGEIHSLKYENTGFFNRGEIEPINWSQRLRQFLPHLEDLVEKEYDKKGLKILQEDKDLLEHEYKPRHLHGDFHPFNTITKEDGIAVIDAEDSLAGPREWDLGKTLAFWAIKFNVRDSFLEGYQEKHELEEGWGKRVRYYTILQLLIGTLRAKKTGWESLHEDHYPTLKKLVDTYKNKD
jgi:Ser/Thr protein kinase RdoA (MazF antagonist)